MGKTLREIGNEISKNWVQNPDGTFSKPKGKEILFQWEKPQMLVPSVENIGVTAKSMLDQIQSEEAGLNKTERARLDYLRMLKMPHLMIQSVTLKLAFDCRLTPDFSYIDENGRMTLEDVKGFQREDALIKMKVAARLFPFFRFVIVKKIKSGWDIFEVKP